MIYEVMAINHQYIFPDMSLSLLLIEYNVQKSIYMPNINLH